MQVLSSLERAPSPPGKLVGARIYLHVSTLDQLGGGDVELIQRFETAAGLTRGLDFNVVKIDRSAAGVISFLDYPDFMGRPFPELKRSWLFDSRTGRISVRDFSDSANPPILHRKELLLDPSHPRRAEFEATTAAAESIGLFDEPHRIGFRESWSSLIKEKGYILSESAFVPIANASPKDTAFCEAADDGGIAVARHLTALSRSGLSAPVHALVRHCLLTSANTFLDYGCGRGDDLRHVTAFGIAGTGWDPYFAPDAPKRSAEIVNLGFVLNVIEDFEERVAALQAAYALTDRVLAVAVMLYNQATTVGHPYRDGFRTSRNTFQKYYHQGELAAFISQVLDEEPLAASPGVFFVFRDKALEQQFLLRRHRTTSLLPRLRRMEKPRALDRAGKCRNLYELHRSLLDGIWHVWLDLGREPAADEVPNINEVTTQLGSLRKALRVLTKVHDLSLIEKSRVARASDITTHLALGQFTQRRPYRMLDAAFQRSIRSFFGTYAAARATARQTLFDIAAADRLRAACLVAAEQGLGWPDDERRSLQLHSSLIERLPTILRVYVHCGTVLFGDIREVDVVKIHIDSGKLTLMKFDDFQGSPLPRMLERVKVNFRSQDVDVFKYEGAYEPPYLYLKSRYINEEFPHFGAQASFDETLRRLDFLDLSGYGPSIAEFKKLLEEHRLAVDGFQLVPGRSIPALDRPCGRYFTYRDLIDCGETQNRLSLSNQPCNPDTYNALHDLAANVLDPVVEYFGMIKLTYGFCSAELARHVKRGIAPTLDQHASCEKKRNGTYICARLGAAADFIVEHENMREVAEWIVEHLLFDRLYFYGDDRPLHVSFGPQSSRAAYDVQERGGRRTPRPLRSESQTKR